VLVKHLVEIKLKLVVKLFYANDNVEINLLWTLFAVSIDTSLISVWVYSSSSSLNKKCATEDGPSLVLIVVDWLRWRFLFSLLLKLLELYIDVNLNLKSSKTACIVILAMQKCDSSNTIEQ